MIRRDSKIIGLKELELANDDIFVRKLITGLDVDSQVIVDETHVAILLKNGIALETLKPGIYPIFDKKVGLNKNEKVAQFRVELFYISKTAKLQMLWGTPTLFDVHDPITDTSAKIGASGEMDIRVKNPRQFYIEVVGSNKTFKLEDLKERLKGKILSMVESLVPDYLEKTNTSILRISEEKLELSKFLQTKIAKMLSREYGLELSSFTVSNINVADKYKSQVSVSMSKTNKMCPNCGFELPENSKFCNNCGIKV